MLTGAQMYARRQRGIVTSLMGFRILPHSTKLTIPFQFSVTESSGFFAKAKTSVWTVACHEPGTGKHITGTAEGDWCLLVDELFKDRLEAPSLVPCRGLLVSVTEWNTIQPGGHSRFEALAILNPATDSAAERDLPRVEVQLPSKTWMADEWVVG